MNKAGSNIGTMHILKETLIQKVKRPFGGGGGGREILPAHRGEYDTEKI